MKKNMKKALAGALSVTAVMAQPAAAVAVAVVKEAITSFPITGLLIPAEWIQVMCLFMIRLKHWIPVL